MQILEFPEKVIESIFTLKNAISFKESSDKYRLLEELLKNAEVEYGDGEIDDGIMIMAETVFESILNYN